MGATAMGGGGGGGEGDGDGAASSSAAATSSTSMGHGGAAPTAFMPRNTSVEDFLSLVESGDIPPVEVCV